MARAKSRHLYVTEADLERLQTLIETGSRNDEKYLNSLEEELAGAHVVSSDELPKNVITMNSTVRVKDLDTEEERVYTLVFPGSTKSIASTVSVLAPIGTALIGYQEGDVIEWDVPAGTRRLSVLEVIYQPERAGRDVQPPRLVRSQHDEDESGA